MSFGVAIIETPRRRRPGKSYDCGKHGSLRVPEIAALTGLCVDTIRYRIKAGLTGEELCAPAWEPLRNRNLKASSRHVVVVACKLGKAFPDRVPSIPEIQAVRPMSRASAVRWRQVWREALEAA
jgi:hypothetical protein